MAVSRKLQLSIAGTLVCGLLLVTWVSHSVKKSRMAMLSVSDIEKVQKLENQMSKKLANEELAKWDHLESKVFNDSPSKASKKIAPKKAVEVRPKAAVTPQGNNFFKSGSGRHSTDVRFVHATKASQPAAHKNIRAATHVHTQKKSLQPENVDGTPPEAGQYLGDDIIDMPVHGGEDEGDVHVPGGSVNRYMFAKGKTSKSAPKHAVVKRERASFRDSHRPVLHATSARSAPTESLGFMGEGPWAHVKEGYAYQKSAGGDYFGKDSVLAKDGGKDGQNGIVVDRWFWTPSAQDHVAEHRRPPCHAACDKPGGCDGHVGLTTGDCDEVFLREADVDRDPTKSAPATYDAYSGNTHGIYKAKHAQILHSKAQPHVARVAAPHSAGLSAPRREALAKRPPGLGIFAPTVQMASPATLEQLSTIDTHRTATDPEVHSVVDQDNFLLHAPIVKALEESNGTALGDEVVDRNRDVTWNTDEVQPYMYKDGSARRSILHGTPAHHPLLGDEVLDGLHDDAEVMVARPHAAARRPTSHLAGRPQPHAHNPHALFMAAAKQQARVQAEAGEPASDGLSDEVVPRREVAGNTRSRETWETFFSAHPPVYAAQHRAAAVQAAAQQVLHASVPRQQLMTYAAHKALVDEGHNSSETSTTTAIKCFGNGSICGDETVDGLRGEAVHVARDQIHKDPKELNIYNIFDFSDSPAPEPQFKDRNGVHFGLTDLAARQAVDQIFDSLPGGMPPARA